jgi:hypothetical protein
VTQLPLNDIQGDTLSSHFDSVRMAQLMWCEPTSYAGASRYPPQGLPNTSTAPWAAAARLADQTEQWAYWELAAVL